MNQFIDEMIPMIKDWPLVNPHNSIPSDLMSAYAFLIKEFHFGDDDGDFIWWNHVRKHTPVIPESPAFFYASVVTNYRQAFSGYGKFPPIWVTTYRDGFGMFSATQWTRCFYRANQVEKFALMRLFYKSEKKSRIIQMVLAYWKSHIRKNNPNLMGDSFKRFFGESHLFTKWMNGKL